MDSEGYLSSPAYFSFRRLLNNVTVLLFKILCMANKLLHFNWMPLGFPGGSDDKESACNTGDLGSISGWGRFPGEGTGYRLQYSCLGKPMDRGAWRVTVHGVAKSQTGLTDWHSLNQCWKPKCTGWVFLHLGKCEVLLNHLSLYFKHYHPLQQKVRASFKRSPKSLPWDPHKYLLNLGGQIQE